MTGEEIKSLMEKFAHNNTGLAVKNRTTKAVVAQFVSNCGSKSDRLTSFVIHVSFLLLELLTKIGAAFKVTQNTLNIKWRRLAVALGL